VDLVAGLLPHRYLERDLVPVDGAFPDGRADLVEVKFPRKGCALLRELEGNILLLRAAAADRHAA